MLYHYHNVVAHREFWDGIRAVCPVPTSATRKNIMAFLYAYANHARVQGDFKGWWFTSLEDVSKRTELSVQETRTVLSTLKTASSVTIISTPTGTRIKLCKYTELYGSPKGQQHGQQHTKRHAKQQMSNNERSTGKGDPPRIPPSSPARAHGAGAPRGAEVKNGGPSRHGSKSFANGKCPECGFSVIIITTRNGNPDNLVWKCGMCNAWFPISEPTSA